MKHYILALMVAMALLIPVNSAKAVSCNEQFVLNSFGTWYQSDNETCPDLTGYYFYFTPDTDSVSIVIRNYGVDQTTLIGGSGQTYQFVSGGDWSIQNMSGGIGIHGYIAASLPIGTPTSAPTSTTIPTATATVTALPSTATAAPTDTATATVTALTSTATAAPTDTATATVTALTSTATAAPTDTATATSTTVPGVTATPTFCADCYPYAVYIPVL